MRLLADLSFHTIKNSLILCQILPLLVNLFRFVNFLYPYYLLFMFWQSLYKINKFIKLRK